MIAAMGIGKFPWGVPPDGELAPRLHPGVDPAEDAAVIRWCLRRWLGRDDAPQGSPLGRMVHDLEHTLVREPSAAPNDEVATAGTAGVAQAHFDFANIVVGHCGKSACTV
ncbi:MAG: hypothetical protein IT379_06335 [Deltaproteobacteria bacterium]|nr:hypothetical protein [Deltaproteobacteria bacterium]